MTDQLSLFDLVPEYSGHVSKHPLYGVWKNMLSRCYNANAQRFERYGGRGIVVCDEWRSSSRSFVVWSIKAGWRPGLQLDRENNDGPYCPGNCRFVTRKVNARNRGDNLRLPDGRALIAVAEQNGLPEYLARNRVQTGWSLEQACGLLPPPAHHSALLLPDGRVACQVARANNITNIIWRRRVSKGWSLLDAVTLPRSSPHPAKVFLSDGTPLADAIRASGLCCATVRGRVSKGWSPDDAVSVPKGGKRPSSQKKSCQNTIQDGETPSAGGVVPATPSDPEKRKVSTKGHQV